MVLGGMITHLREHFSYNSSTIWGIELKLLSSYQNYLTNIFQTKSHFEGSAHASDFT